MRKLRHFLSRAHKNQKSYIKFQLVGFGLIFLGLLIAAAGNWISGNVGTIILIFGLAVAAVGGAVAGWNF